MRIAAVALAASFLAAPAMAVEPMTDTQMDTVTAGVGSQITLPFASLSGYNIARPAPFPVIDVSGVNITPPAFPAVDIVPPVFPGS